MRVVHRDDNAINAASLHVLDIEMHELGRPMVVIVSVT